MQFPFGIAALLFQAPHSQEFRFLAVTSAARHFYGFSWDGVGRKKLCRLSSPFRSRPRAATRSLSRTKHRFCWLRTCRRLFALKDTNVGLARERKSGSRKPNFSDFIYTRFVNKNTPSRDKKENMKCYWVDTASNQIMAGKKHSNVDSLLRPAALPCRKTARVGDETRQRVICRSPSWTGDLFRSYQSRVGADNDGLVTAFAGVTRKGVHCDPCWPLTIKSGWVDHYQVWVLRLRVAMTENFFVGDVYKRHFYVVIRNFFTTPGPGQGKKKSLRNVYSLLTRRLYGFLTTIAPTSVILLSQQSTS